MNAQPETPPAPSITDLESISTAALKAAQDAGTAAEGALAAATAAAERAAQIGLTLPPELVEQIGTVAGMAAAAATEERLRSIGALRDLGEETPPPAPAAGAGGDGTEPPGSGTPAPPAVVPDPSPGDHGAGKSWAARFLGE